MHSTSLLTKTAYDRYLRYGLTPPDALDLKQARATKHYIWRTRRDGCVRPSHAQNDGKVLLGTTRRQPDIRVTRRAVSVLLSLTRGR